MLTAMMHSTKILLSALLLCLLFKTSRANPVDYENRRTALVDSALVYFNDNAIALQAYRGLPVNQSTLTSYLDGLRTGQNADFQVVQLIRVLELSNGEYDQQILPVLDSVPFWLTSNETKREYWSENHMILWMSSDWLLHEKCGRAIDSSLELRLRHYLKLKLQYGFYEFFSSVYSPFTLAGLLHLADFARDPEIKADATKAAQNLLKEILLLTNDKGVFYPTAGRNYPSKYEGPYGHSHCNLIYQLTGLGPMPLGVSIGGGIFASSSLPVDDVIQSYRTKIDTTFINGHLLTEGFVINQQMAKNDKTIFQWSSGGYFHPDVAESTARLIVDLNLWNHPEFIEFRSFSRTPIELARDYAVLASAISESSVLSREEISIFKNKSITLSSVHDFWKGKLGYQQYPCIANVGTTAVYTGSGKPEPVWDNRPALHANEHLPCVTQKSNVALIMYRPERGLALWNHKELDVALHWKPEDFDEERESGLWLLGRQGNSYVAVRRKCTGTINSVKACSDPDAQTWVIVVGNDDLYGNFDNFQQIIEQAEFTEKWYYLNTTAEWVYYSQIKVDGKVIEYEWKGDATTGPVNPNANIVEISSNTLNIYPSPAKEQLNIDLSSVLNKSVLIEITNALGQKVYTEKIATATSLKQINISNLAGGMYVVDISGDGIRFTKKVMIKK